MIAVTASGAPSTIVVANFRETNIHPSEMLHEQFQTYLELFRSRRIWGYALCMAFSTGAYYAFLGGAPLAASTLFNMSPARLGLYMGSITAGFIFGSFIAGRYAARFPLTTRMISGRVVACVGLLVGLVVVSIGYLNEFTLFGACIFVGIGNGITMPSSSSGALSVRPKLAGSASGLSGALVVAGGAAVSAITGSVLTEGNAVYGLLGVMLVSSALGLGAALYVLYVDRYEI